MTADFLLETTKTRRKGHGIFQIPKEKKRINAQFYNITSENNFQELKEIKTFLKNRRGEIQELVVCHETKQKSIAEVSFLNRKEILNGGILEHQEGRRKRVRAKICINITDFPFLLQYSKLGLMAETKSIIISFVVLNVGQKIFMATILYRGKKRKIERFLL